MNHKWKTLDSTSGTKQKLLWCEWTSVPTETECNASCATKIKVQKLCHKTLMQFEYLQAATLDKLKTIT